MLFGIMHCSGPAWTWINVKSIWISIQFLSFWSSRELNRYVVQVVLFTMMVVLETCYHGINWRKICGKSECEHTYFIIIIILEIYVG